MLSVLPAPAQAAVVSMWCYKRSLPPRSHLVNPFPLTFLPGSPPAEFPARPARQPHLAGPRAGSRAPPPPTRPHALQRPRRWSSPGFISQLAARPPVIFSPGRSREPCFSLSLPIRGHCLPWQAVEGARLVSNHTLLPSKFFQPAVCRGGVGGNLGFPSFGVTCVSVSLCSVEGMWETEK